jgi:hypothetical protein
MQIAKVYFTDFSISLIFSSDPIGILIGKLAMELGGKVTIVCEKTRYSADIEFKLKVRTVKHFSLSLNKQSRIDFL